MLTIVVLVLGVSCRGINYGLAATMRRLPVVLALALLLAAEPLPAQLASTAQAHLECPPGEPDSLQINWTKPCDSGTCLLDA